VAYIVDSIVVGVLVSGFVLIGLAVFFAGATFEGNKVTSVSSVATFLFLIIVLIGTAISVLYFPFFWARGGQTPGMRLFSLRVVRDSDGGSIGWGTALLRLVGLIVAGAVFYLGYIWIFIDKRRRGWQDLIAGTIVVKQP
jgi:uncharacterized RDD family membrane protein YckC